MGKKERLKELYEKVDNVKPLAEKDGHLYVTFEDAAILNSYNADEPNTGMQTRNHDGTLASTGKRVHAVNPDYFFANRYKVKGKKLYVVSGHTTDGYRCIKEQSSGRVFLKTIPVYVICREPDIEVEMIDENGKATKGKEKGNLYLEKMTTVSDTEFIAEYTNILDNKSMAEILPLITAVTEVTADSMPI